MTTLLSIKNNNTTHTKEKGWHSKDSEIGPQLLTVIIKSSTNYGNSRSECPHSRQLKNKNTRNPQGQACTTELQLFTVIIKSSSNYGKSRSCQLKKQTHTHTRSPQGQDCTTEQLFTVIKSPNNHRKYRFEFEPGASPAGIILKAPVAGTDSAQVLLASLKKSLLLG